MNDRPIPQQADGYWFSHENYDPEDIARRFHEHGKQQNDCTVFSFDDLSPLTRAALVVTVHRFLVQLYAHGRGAPEADAEWFWNVYADLAEDDPWQDQTDEGKAHHVMVTTMFIDWFDAHALRRKIPDARRYA